MIYKENLSEKEIDPDPLVQFDNWFKERLTGGIEIPNSVSLATATVTGIVSIRTVLMKDFDKSGFIFFTNYNSKKGSQLLSNPRAALLFYWPETGRQVIIEGFTKKISETESESYFKTRPRESQIAAWASEQSSVIPDRQHLELRFDFYNKKYSKKDVDKPPHWGGFRLEPDWFEFWQEGDFRLHDRLTYKKINGAWLIRRLAP